MHSRDDDMAHLYAKKQVLDGQKQILQKAMLTHSILQKSKNLYQEGQDMLMSLSILNLNQDAKIHKDIDSLRA